MSFKLVIFDLDGTLLDTLEDLANAGNHVLYAHGLPTHPIEDYRYFVGDGIRKLIERMCPPGTSKELQEQLLAENGAWYKTHSQISTKPYEGVLELLDSLKEKGISAAVLSNKPHFVAKDLVPQYFGQRFALVHGQREGYPCKPDGRLVEEIQKELGMAPQECAYCGDSGVDMRTACNGGAFPIGAAWGFRDEKELWDNGAKAIAKNPMEILKILENQ